MYVFVCERGGGPAVCARPNSAALAVPPARFRSRQAHLAGRERHERRVAPRRRDARAGERRPVVRVCVRHAGDAAVEPKHCKLVVGAPGVGSVGGTAPGPELVGHRGDKRGVRACQAAAAHQAPAHHAEVRSRPCPCAATAASGRPPRRPHLYCWSAMQGRLLMLQRSKLPGHSATHTLFAKLTVFTSSSSSGCAGARGGAGRAVGRDVRRQGACRAAAAPGRWAARAGKRGVCVGRERAWQRACSGAQAVVVCVAGRW